MAREKKHSNANEKCQKMRNSKCWQNTILGLILQTSTAFHLLSSFHISFWFQIHLQFFLSHCVTALRPRPSRPSHHRFYSKLSSFHVCIPLCLHCMSIHEHTAGLRQKSQPTWHWMASELHIHAISSIPYRPIRCRGMKYWYLLMTFISDSCNMLSNASTSPTTSCHHSPRCSRKTECQP